MQIQTNASHSNRNLQWPTSVPVSIWASSFNLINIYDRLYNKQLLNEVEHDIENYQGRGLRYHTTESTKSQTEA